MNEQIKCADCGTTDPNLEYVYVTSKESDFEEDTICDPCLKIRAGQGQRRRTDPNHND